MSSSRTASCVDHAILSFFSGRFDSGRVSVIYYVTIAQDGPLRNSDLINYLHMSLLIPRPVLASWVPIFSFLFTYEMRPHVGSYVITPYRYYLSFTALADWFVQARCALPDCLSPRPGPPAQLPSAEPGTGYNNSSHELL